MWGVLSLIAVQFSPGDGRSKDGGSLLIPPAAWRPFLAAVDRDGMRWAVVERGGAADGDDALAVDVVVHDGPRLGPTARSVLGDTQKRALEWRAVHALPRRPPQCKLFGQIAGELAVRARPRGRGAPTIAQCTDTGYGPVRARLLDGAPEAGGAAVIVRLPVNEWGRELLSARKWCTFASCFKADHPPCQRARALGAPLPIFFTAQADRFVVAATFAQMALQRAEPSVTVVADPAEACAYVYSHPHGLEADGFAWEHVPPWRTVDGVAGRNHVLIQPQCIAHCDRIAPPRPLGPTGDAVIVSAAHYHGMFNRGHDLMIVNGISSAARALLNGRGAASRTGNATSPGAAAARPLLYSFRGSVLGRTRWFDVRVLASEFAPHTPDAVVEVWPKDGRRRFQCLLASARHRLTTEREYIEMLQRSAYAFAPGGGGPYSFRFLEVVAAGAVPVVPADLILPHDEPHAASERVSRLHRAWRRCVVRVTNTDVLVLRDLLLALGPPGSAEYEKRQRACASAVEILTERVHGRDDSGREATLAHQLVERNIASLVWEELRGRVLTAAAASTTATSSSLGGNHSRQTLPSSTTPLVRVTGDDD